MLSRRPRFRPLLEQLDDRIVPALMFTNDSAGNLTISGTPTAATITIDVINVDEFSIDGGPTMYVPGNINVILAPGTSATTTNTTLEIDLNGIDIDTSFTIDLGVGDDTLTFLNSGGGPNSIFGNVYARGVNTLNLNDANGVDISGNLTVDSSFESRSGMYDFTNTFIGGHVTIVGGANSDNVNLGAITIVGGNVSLQLGNGANGVTTAADSIINGRLQVNTGAGVDSVGLAGMIGADANFYLGNGSNSLMFTGLVSGWFIYNGGFNDDTVNLGDGGTGAFIGGNISVNLGHGANTLVFDADASVGGLSFNIIGGAGTDDITFSGDLSFSRVTASLGASTDTVIITASVMLPSYMYIDFGAGVDVLISAVPLPPSFIFRNYP